MKYTTLVLLLILRLNTFGQWNIIHTLNANNYTSSCVSIGKDTCFIGAENGTIYRTQNGGTSWDSVITLFKHSWITDIKFPTRLTGYACGGTAFGNYSSCIAKTMNGGQTWDSLTSNAFGYEFRDMSMTNDSMGYFAGDFLVKTSDGGKTFTSIPVPFNSATSAIHFFNFSTGLIAAREYVNANKSRYRILIGNLTDGGANWLTTFIDSSNSDMWSSKNINDIDFSNSLNGIAVGDNGLLLSSTDGGMSWNKYSLTNDTTHLTHISLSRNSLIGYISAAKYNTITNQGRIYKTSNAGALWQLNFTSDDEGIFGISISTDNIAYANGYRKVIKTINGGVNGIQFLTPSDKQAFLYPNPVRNKFTIQLPDENLTSVKLILRIFDSSGRMVIEKSIHVHETIDPELENGVYFYQLEGEGSKISTGKIIVQN